MNLLSIIILAALWLFPFSSYALAETAMPLNELAVRIDPANNAIRGVSRISLPAGQSAKINLMGIKVTSVSVRDRALAVEPGTESITFTPGSAEDIMKIEFSAEYRSLPESNPGNPGTITGNYVGPEGILLMDNWHPAVDGASLYRLTAVLPPGFEGISEADQISILERAGDGREFIFVFEHPLRNLTLVAGRYRVEMEKRGDIEIATYFFSDDKGLSKSYREFSGKYLDMYEKLLGKYPYRRFAVVENFLSAGYSFPTFTLLGKDILKMPFILETSLGHEILHQWFGNLVYTDDSSGNWSEGLTTYLADHRYEELKGKGWDYRKQILISFGSYVTPENDFPLRSFTGREGRVSAAIGYGKSAMVFHMLRRIVGDEIFFGSLRKFVEKNRFKTASWSDIREVFESGYGQDLGWFFKQWIDESGVPELEISGLELKYKGRKAVVSFTVEQKGQKYKLFLPVAVQLRGNNELRKVFVIEKEPKTLVEVEIEAEDTPVKLVIDDNYDLFRKLSDKEFPPVVSRLLGAEKKIFVVPQGKADIYAGLSGFLKGEGFAVKNESEVTYEDIKNYSLLIPGFETSIAKRLLGKLGEQNADFYLITRENPFNKKGVIVVVGSPVLSELPLYVQRITHYGKYGNLSFKDNRNILKTVDETERGIGAVISEDTPGIEISRLTDIYGVIEKASVKEIIYVGEEHDKFEHHRVQLQVIKEMYKKYKKIAIGMEMFQKPFQQALDDYIAGKTDEKTFLKKSEYFKQWGYDYNLYREILLFARGYKIPVIALNIQKKLVSKVSKEGLLALTADELKEVPEYFDISDKTYYDRLRGFFERHEHAKEMNFDFFYEAQILWDESMARNLDEFIGNNPEYKVVVLAGEGHMAFGSGIPRRCFRLNKREYAIILNDGDVEKDIADFLLFPSPVSMPESPKLGALLKDEDKKVIISQFTPDSVAQQAGLKEDDIILSLDGTSVESVDDIRIFLLSKKKGDEITVRVLRERFLFGPAEREFKVIL